MRKDESKERDGNKKVKTERNIFTEIATLVQDNIPLPGSVVKQV